MALYYAKGVEVPQDLGRAATLYRKSCDDARSNRGNESCRSLAWMYLKGRGLEKSVPEGIRYFEIGCEDGHGESCRDLANRYFSGDYVDKSMLKGNAILQGACDRRVAEACSDLGYSYDKGRGVTRDTQRAKGLFASACELDSAVGCYNMGQVTKRVNSKQSMGFMEKGCALGYAQACFEHGLQLSRGGDVDRGEKLVIDACERQSKRACAWLASRHRTQAGRRQYAKAGCDLGSGESCYLAGRSDQFQAPVSHVGAADFYDRACKAKYASGCTALAALFESSKELPRDEARSLALRKQRCFMDAERSLFRACKPEWADEMCSVRPESCAQYAYKLAKGTHGQVKDTKLSLRLWKQTCEAKHQNGCWGMSDAYDQGWGVTKSKTNARKWLKRACEIPGEEVACEKRARELK